MDNKISKLVFATNNRHKTEEIKQILSGYVNVLTLSEIGFTGDIPEEQDTLEGNAAQKAFYIFDKLGMDCFSDDTGLEIIALNGEPGVYSARYAGEACSFEDNMNLVLKNMEGITDRRARFRTVIALVVQGRLKTFEGAVEGSITSTKKGKGGFGYDPIFIPKGYNKTFAEMTSAEKNSISHRAIAVNSFSNYLILNSK